MGLKKFTTDYDGISDVLYLKFEDERIKNSQECPNDGYLILNFNEKHETIGMIFIGLTELDSKEWFTHPDRSLIPFEFLEYLDNHFSKEKYEN
jgi:hypothetical protein